MRVHLSCMARAWLGLMAAIALAAPSHAAGSADCPARLRFVYGSEAAPPFVIGTGDEEPEPPGLLVQWLRESLTSMSCTTELVLARRPAARVRLELAAGEHDLAIGVYRPALAPTLVWPHDVPALRPLPYLSRTLLQLYVLEPAAFAWPSRVFDEQQARVGVVRGSVAELVARERGWKLDLATDMVTNVAKLRSARFEAMLGQDVYIEPYLRTLQDKRIRALAPPVGVGEYYLPAYRGFFERHEGFVRTLWTRMCERAHALMRDPAPCSP